MVKFIKDFNNDIQINEKIKDEEIRLIGADGEVLGIMSPSSALDIAQQQELDLVKISPNAKPPVCKIVDFGKYKYDMLKKEKESRKNQKQVEIKEIRISPNIDKNDLNTKINAGKKFLSLGNKLKVTLRFRGREMAHMSSSEHILSDFATALNTYGTLEKEPKTEGKNITIILAPKK